MTLSLCLGAQKSWLIVLKCPLRFATWHHNECLSSKIALFNGWLCYSVDWYAGLCNGVELPSCNASPDWLHLFWFFTKVIRKLGHFCVQYLSDRIYGTMSCLCLCYWVLWDCFVNHENQMSIHLYLILIPLRFAEHTHPCSAVIHMCAFLHIHTWTLPITKSSCWALLSSFIDAT